MHKNQTIIKAKDVSMCFQMSYDRIQSVKEYIVQTFKGKVRYEEFWALKDINFEIKKGEVVGLVGSNGAGKSTLLKIISGILKPTSGKIQVNGSIVPMLELGSGFDFDLTGRENIFLNGAVLGYSEKFLNKKYDEIVSFSELGKFIEVPLRNYSSGMIARLAFSIAAMVEPDILIVDEILSVGDAAFQRKSGERMKEMMNGGTTVLLVSHSIAQIQELCDSAIWLQNGQQVLSGDADIVCGNYIGGYAGTSSLNAHAIQGAEYSMMYFNRGSDFNPEDARWLRITPYGGEFSQYYTFPEPCKRLRYDPVLLGGYELSNLSFSSTQEPVNVLALNCSVLDQTYVMGESDPQIYLEFQKPISNIKVSGNLIENVKLSPKLRPQKNFKYEVHLCEHCNLNCKSCFHFAPFSEPAFLLPSDYEKDCQRLSQLFDHKAQLILLSGGEPLLHKNICEFMRISREAFPSASIRIVTNALLLPKMDTQFWRSCERYEIAIGITKFPISLDYLSLEKTAQDMGVKIYYENSSDVIEKKMDFYSLDLNGEQNINMSFAHCALANDAYVLSHGRLYTCPICAFVPHLIDYFNLTVSYQKENGIDIYGAQSAKEIMDFLARPVPMCAYCDVNSRMKDNKWEPSQKELSEWISTAKDTEVQHY
ncbi:ABC transporter related [Desulfitobacterium hafniense DCB-2]|uniref:ABC transporter related n=1 Tax=Desulfitobacterium hafniense (strain DSM 10664 / DCB-2) TaxID=272564 RepID=B8FVR6_DESHD|nr:ABC transporter related [Desulfitobacterium hafniense DCB-2]